MVTISKKVLQSRLSVIQAMRNPNSIVCFTRLENDGLIISMITKEIGACAWLLCGSLESEIVDHSIVDLNNLLKAISTGSGEDIDVDFIEETTQDSINIRVMCITTDKATIRLEIIPAEVGLVDESGVNSLVNKLKTPVTDAMKIDKNKAY